ncbi:right-handed parallel beta-helix repeat-containing protein [Vibrio sp. 404]|uniref:Right-handed parallel beta-helix repeat-containing protein n=1 Tax=Vibrio marinisediminis TaxID=2758441 RepID=A0A7W2FUB4_9VIBR|nr:right-handed parallel beta-helix repeat-containing protein [Vibrio marinisediminis]MBA5764368.1 right-handed parallel beta-helix repeat-containing protein [Vibrio marinisediminis]
MSKSSAFIFSLCLYLGLTQPSLATYNVKIKPSEPYAYPELPDVSQYNKEFFYEHLDKWSDKAEIALERLPEQHLIRRYRLITNIHALSKAQGGLPKVLVVSDGLATLQDISNAFPNALVQSNENGVDTYTAKFPILIKGDAALLISEGKELRLSEERRTFLVGGGEFFVLSGTVKSWREKTQTPSTWTGNKKDFRPFYTGWNGSRTYFYNSTFESLGYNNIKAYGITITSSYLSKEELKLMPWIRGNKATGVLMKNKFIDMYYGFYCYKAQDIVILENEYIKNVVYGIDPHDYSDRLIIAKNRTWGTLIKHGIIISREVNNSFIFDNVSYNNNRSGIMLDRTSLNNVIARNTAYHNGGDGLTIQESDLNLVWDNIFYDNKQHGINVRNSQHVRLYDNTVFGNLGAGIYGHINELREHTHRDLELDPFTTKVSIDVRGGKLLANSGGAINVRDFEYAKIAEVMLGENGDVPGKPFKGDLSPYNREILNSHRKNHYLKLSKTIEEE